MAYLDPGASFAQTGAEFSLESDVSDDEDLRAQVSGRHGQAHEAYEMRDASSRDHPRRGPPDDHGGAVLDRSDDDLDLDPDPEAAARTVLFDRPDSAGSTVASFQLYTPDEEAAVRRQFDRKLVLFVALLYMLSFLDRSNIGNARVAGMDDDLQTAPPRDDWYERALQAFYAAYILFEWMSLLWKVVPPHVYVALVVLSWGVVASLQALAPSYPVLVALRFLLGIGEAAFTGVPFYLSFFYRPDELALRTAVFIAAAPLATSFAAALAWLVVRLARLTPIAPWRLLFLCEGFPSVLVSVLAWHRIPDSPDTASFLTKRQRKVARLRLRDSNASSSSSSSPSSGLQIRDALAVLLSPVAWLTAAMLFLTNMAYASLPVFLPQILRDMGHSALAAQALAAPPYLLAFLAVLLTARASDRRRARAAPLALHALLSAAGYALLALARPLRLPPALRYLAVYPAAVGFFTVVALLITWSINNQPTESRRGAGFALMQLVGQCGPLLAARLYPDADAPYYTPGMQTCAGAMLAVALLALVLRAYLTHLNRGLDAAARARAAAGPACEEQGLVGPGRTRGGRSDSFRYIT